MWNGCRIFRAGAMRPVLNDQLVPFEGGRATNCPLCRFLSLSPDPDLSPWRGRMRKVRAPRGAYGVAGFVPARLAKTTALSPLASPRTAPPSCANPRACVSCPDDYAGRHVLSATRLAERIPFVARLGLRALSPSRRDIYTAAPITSATGWVDAYRRTICSSMRRRSGMIRRAHAAGRGAPDDDGPRAYQDRQRGPSAAGELAERLMRSDGRPPTQIAARPACCAAAKASTTGRCLRRRLTRSSGHVARHTRMHHGLLGWLYPPSATSRTAP
jgi:hypothetical protein